jgi:hypothetical protein
MAQSTAGGNSLRRGRYFATAMRETPGIEDEWEKQTRLASSRPD